MTPEQAKEKVTKLLSADHHGQPCPFCVKRITVALLDAVAAEKKQRDTELYETVHGLNETWTALLEAERQRGKKLAAALEQCRDYISVWTGVAPTGESFETIHPADKRSLEARSALDSAVEVFAAYQNW